MSSIDSDEIKDGVDAPMTLEEFEGILRDIRHQRPWRVNADKEADYADGNQLDTELLTQQAELGIPPAKENVIGPAIDSVCGYEAKTRTDWRVTADGDVGGKDLADAVNFKINQAERHSRADRAMSQAFRAMIAVGLGWVEVRKASDSRRFSWACSYIHRNEIWWDMTAKEPDLRDARWLRRVRWVDRSRVAVQFPKHRDIVEGSLSKFDADSNDLENEGGHSTGLRSSLDAERAWTDKEDSWWNPENDQVQLSEVWYRRYVDTVMLKLANGRVVEFDLTNERHVAAVQTGMGTLSRELISKVRRAYWLGPHCLHDDKSPYPHDYFPYVPFWGYREDMTGVPYGMVRNMLFSQDNLNATIALVRWGLGSVTTIRTKGIVAMDDDVFRRQVARRDADVVLDAATAAQPGARFEINRDFQLNNQQFQMMDNSRASIDRISGVSAAFRGQQGTARSGTQEQTQLEQAQMALADLMDNFKDARQQVGELLLACLVHEIGQQEQTVLIEGDAIHEPRAVTINKPEVNPSTGVPYISNDLSKQRLKLALDDVPTSSSFRQQQLTALSEAIKGAPPQVQQATMPFLVNLMDVPYKQELVQKINEAMQQQTPEQMREQVKRELMLELKEKELALREREVVARETLMQAQTKHVGSQTVQTNMQTSYSAIQGAGQIVMNPGIAPVADEMLKGSGWQPGLGGVDPNLPIPQQSMPTQQFGPQTAGAPMQQQDGGEAAGAMPPVAEGQPEQGAELQGDAFDVRQNTSPAFPPVPQQPESPMEGIETPEHEAQDLGEHIPV